MPLRLVLFESKTAAYIVYENKVIVAHYAQEIPDTPTFLSAEQVEDIRAYDYKVKA